MKVVNERRTKILKVDFSYKFIQNKMSIEGIEKIINYSNNRIRMLDKLIEKKDENYKKYVREQQRLNYLVDYYVLVLRRSGFIRNS